MVDMSEQKKSADGQPKKWTTTDIIVYVVFALILVTAGAVVRSQAPEPGQGLLGPAKLRIKDEPTTRP